MQRILRQYQRLEVLQLLQLVCNALLVLVVLLKPPFHILNGRFRVFYADVVLANLLLRLPQFFVFLSYGDMQVIAGNPEIGQLLILVLQLLAQFVHFSLFLLKFILLIFHHFRNLLDGVVTVIIVVTLHLLADRLISLRLQVIRLLNDLAALNARGLSVTDLAEAYVGEVKKPSVHLFVQAAAEVLQLGLHPGPRKDRLRSILLRLHVLQLLVNAVLRKLFLFFASDGVHEARPLFKCMLLALSQLVSSGLLSGVLGRVYEHTEELRRIPVLFALVVDAFGGKVRVLVKVCQI